MQKTIFKIIKMDCPSEEQLIRMKLQKFDEIKSLEFDIANRKLTVHHIAESQPILSALETLNLDTTLISTEENTIEIEADTSSMQRKLLWTVLIINFLFFGLEMLFGIFSNSMGLVADSLDMLADSIVYALALFAVGGTIARKNNIAKFAGYFQILLAVIGFVEVVRRFIGVEKMPDFQTMIVVSVLALIANVICLYLLQKGKSKEAHMQASMIFTSNDVIINSGVILAGLLVNWLNSGYPDLIIGAIVFVIVARGAYRILQLAK
ncbi:MAG: cation transporter [Flavobacteriales bacterium]|jgi:Co/Zn/Cd efflux system component|uniref:cation transporter n=1 Tax=Algoriphagus sp. TaxID=1872435 RepID=UPI001AF40F20|nr:cation transporter [Algoriphagus sp.]MBU3661529.1 cation transporter [Flavobacteriales bacterium]MCB0509113.1 cation transporter [Bacteroidota bacterium]QQS29250.1 MAG: cation transporter [Sphingobacteriales bacterium]